jgi:hypothetical protein
MAQLTLDQTDIDRIEEVSKQFDPAEHLATAGLLEDLRFEEREAALKFMREMLRDELYGGLIERAALEAMVEHRVCSSGIAKQKLDADWDDRFRPLLGGRQRVFRESHWGHNLSYMSEDIWNFISTVQSEQSNGLFKALWVLMDLAVIAMFGPIGNNHDEPAIEEA